MKENIMSVATGHIQKIKQLSDAGQVVWTTLATPKPDAMRAFTGTAEGYTINVAQANVDAVGVVCEGIVVATKTFTVIRLPNDVADSLYHKAQAGMN